MSDRIALMRNGHIEQLSGPLEMYERPATRYVADFIGETNLLPAVVQETREQEAVLRVGAAVVRARASRALPAGTQAWLSIRPEFLAVLPDGGATPGFNVLSGVVREAVFVGSVTKLYLTLADGGRLVLHTPPGGASAAPGQTVRVGWPTERGICVLD